MALDYVVLTNHRPPRKQLTPESRGQQLLTAIKNEQLSTFIHLVENGADVNQRGDNWWTPLTLASHLGRTDVVKYLLQSDTKCLDYDDCNPPLCDVNHSTDSGDTPLICGSREGHNSVVELLLEAGCDPNLPNEYSSVTPLLVAIDGGHDDVITALLAYDADVTLTDNVKMTPLYSAIKLKDSDKRETITRQIILAGCDVNIGSQDHAPLFLAARKGYLPIVKMLCEAHSDINIANKFGVTPLYEATIKGHNDIVKYLLSLRCKAKTQDMYGISPLHAAASFNNVIAIKLLIKGGGSVKQRDRFGRCPVHVAMDEGKAGAVRVFLEHGIDITQPPTSIKRLSHLNKVFEDGHTETAKILISGCSKLPLNKCTAAVGLLRRDQALLQQALLSGLLGLPEVFLSSDHPAHQLLDPGLTSWLSDYHRKPRTLQEACRVHIRRLLKNKILCLVEQLPLPAKLQKYIIFDT